jgi:hypothetical protein
MRGHAKHYNGERIMPTADAPAPPDKSKETIALSAATMGHDLVAALLYELRNMPDHWARMNEQLQQKAIERIKEKVRDAVLKAQHMLTTGEFQAVPAVLEYVGRKGGISAKITVDRGALCRHAFFDAQGSKILVVITDPQRWLARMDELKATGNQADLFNRTDVDYDPAKDQPGYRRDTDAFAPAAPSWAAMKENLGLVPPDPVAPPNPDAEKPAGEDAQKPPEELPPVVPTGDDERVTDEQVALRELQERLAASSVAVSLGALQARTPAERAAAEKWLDAYEKNPKKCKMERPTWFPTEGNEK